MAHNDKSTPPRFRRDRQRAHRFIDRKKEGKRKAARGRKHKETS